MKTLYQTEKGTIFTSEQEAIIAEVLEESCYYLEAYKLKDIAEVFASKFHFISIISGEPSDGKANN